MSARAVFVAQACAGANAGTESPSSMSRVGFGGTIDPFAVTVRLRVVFLCRAPYVARASDQPQHQH
eukprot:5766831-Lingulodinium_polyedra.AAC.1